jgi:hypothetical protein
MNLFLDIESIPTQRDDVRAYLEESLRDELTQAIEAVCAPSNYKDEAKIAEFCDNKRAQLKSDFAAKITEKVNATGLDGSFGHVCVIGWACDDDEPQCVLSADNEAALLGEFSKRLLVTPSERFTTTIIGHNVASFDLRFLTQRYIVNGIRPPLAIARAAQAKPWEGDKVFDTMVQWAGIGGRISLDKLCLALSIPSPKGDMDGSMVAEYVAAGRIEEVAAYCKRDVEAARAVWRRMTFAPTPIMRQFDDVPA